MLGESPHVILLCTLPRWPTSADTRPPTGIQLRISYHVPFRVLHIIIIIIIIIYKLYIILRYDVHARFQYSSSPPTNWIKIMNVPW